MFDKHDDHQHLYIPLSSLIDFLCLIIFSTSHDLSLFQVSLFFTCERDVNRHFDYVVQVYLYSENKNTTEEDVAVYIVWFIYMYDNLLLCIYVYILNYMVSIKCD